MAEEEPKIVEAYKQMALFLAQAKAEMDLKTKFLLLEQSLENYATKAQIYEMIKKLIKERDDQEKEADKKVKESKDGRIKWKEIFERIITWAIIAGITALIMDRMAK